MTYQRYRNSEQRHAGSAGVQIEVVGLAGEEAPVKGEDGDLDESAPESRFQL